MWIFIIARPGFHILKFHYSTKANTHTTPHHHLHPICPRMHRHNFPFPLNLQPPILVSNA
jgi:hypothetical protein